MRHYYLVFTLLFSSVVNAGLPDIFIYADENSVTLKAPGYVEFASSITISIASLKMPATSAYITDVRFFVEHNPNCPVAHFKIEPGTLVEGLTFRLNLVDSTTVYALVEFSNGLSLKGEKTINVRQRGCAHCNPPTGYFSAQRQQQRKNIPELFKCTI